MERDRNKRNWKREPERKRRKITPQGQRLHLPPHPHPAKGYYIRKVVSPEKWSWAPLCSFALFWLRCPQLGVPELGQGEKNHIIFTNL